MVRTKQKLFKKNRSIFRYIHNQRDEIEGASVFVSEGQRHGRSA
jgi:hypothetical protein